MTQGAPLTAPRLTTLNSPHSYVLFVQTWPQAAQKWSNVFKAKV